MVFADRRDAGRQLLEAMSAFRGTNPVVLALPRGGVPVAAEIARGLGAPLDLLIVRKLGVPDQPEVAMGAIVDAPTPIIVRNPDVIAAAGVTEAQFAAVLAAERDELDRRRTTYLRGRERVPRAGRVVIVVDDGLATGTTMLAALRAARAQRPLRLVAAVPVAAGDSLDKVGKVADAVVCLDVPEPFLAIGYHYRDFDQLSDADVLDALAQAQKPPAPPHRPKQ